MFQLVIFQSVLALSGSYYVNVSTPNKKEYVPLFEYGVDIRNTNHIKFATQACNDVHVALVKNEDFDTDIIEMVIGGWQNTKSVLRIMPQGPAVESIEGTFLDCGVRKKFWIDWFNTSIRLGRGDIINNSILLNYQALSHPINFMGIYTAYGSEGVWTFEIPEPSSDQVSMSINPDNTAVLPTPTSASSISSIQTSLLTENYAESTSSPGQQHTHLNPSSTVSFSDIYLLSSSTSADLNSKKKSIIPHNDVSDMETITTTENGIFQFLSTYVNNETTPSYSSQTSSVVEGNTTMFSIDVESTNGTNLSMCSCRCSNTDLTEKETNLKIKEIREILTLNKSKLSSARRKLQSTDDMRPLSVTIGMLMGVTVLTCTFCLIVIPDTVSLIHYVYMYAHARKANNANISE